MGFIALVRMEGKARAGFDQWLIGETLARLIQFVRTSEDYRILLELSMASIDDFFGLTLS